MTPLEVAVRALRRIDMGYRSGSGLTIEEQAYGMCSEAKRALEIIAQLADGVEQRPKEFEEWPGQFNAEGYGK